MALSQISGMVVPKDPRLNILMDFAHFRMSSHRTLFANLLSAASLLIFNVWILEELPSIEDWVNKVRYMCLVSKVSALNS